MFVELKRQVTYRNRRKPVDRVTEHDISDSLWEALQKMAEENGFCSVGKWDWNKGVLYISRGDGVDETFEKYCNAPADWKMYNDEVRKTINFELAPMKFKYEYVVKVLKVDLDNKRAFIQHYPTNKMIEEGNIKDLKEYWVDISDRCIYEKIKPKDDLLVRKFLNDQYLGVQVWESYHEATSEEIEEQLWEMEEIFGDY